MECHDDFQPSHICCIIPPHMLHTLANNPNADPYARDCARITYRRLTNLRQQRHEACFSGMNFDGNDDSNDPPGPGAGGHQGIVPGYMHQSLIDNPEASHEEKSRASKSLKIGEMFRSLRRGSKDKTPDTTKEKDLSRLIYDSKGTSSLRENLVRKEGQTKKLDPQEQDVWDSFQKTYDFYFDVLKRDSVDGLGLKLVGNVHYDDEEPPPGFDNAFWDGSQMVFGDGDGKVFGPFTKSVDVIGHELTHGVTQYTANLPYAAQSGALNESMSDVFGIMVKQYALKQTSAQADWLIGAELFLPGINAKALRSMKAPGTAFKNTPFGSDSQPATMKDYVVLPVDNNPRNDNGGVHINSGIPNHAFYLASIGLGGNSWDKAGPIWYQTLLDPKLKAYCAQKANWTNCFQFFADLTVTHATSMYGADVANIVKKAWADVGLDGKTQTPVMATQ